MGQRKAGAIFNHDVWNDIENVCDSFLGFAWLLSRNFVFAWDFPPPCIKAYTGAYDRTKSGNLQQISVCDCAQVLSRHSPANAGEDG